MSDDLIPLFVAEGRELLEQAGQDLLALERSGEDAGALESLFRAVHTLKGAAGLVGFAAMGELFHVAEDRLALIRQGDGAFDTGLAEGLMAALWQTERWLEEAAASGRTPQAGLEDAAAIARRLAGETARPAAPAPSPSPTAEPDWAGELRRAAPAATAATAAFRYTPSPDAYFLGDDPAAIAGAVPQLLHLELKPREPFGDLAAYDPFACNLQLCGLSAAPAAAVREAFRFVPDQVQVIELAPAAQAPAAAAAGRSLRVDASRIDALAAAVDDLVVARNALEHLIARASGQLEPALARGLAAAQADLARRVGRLHDSVTRVRLTPLAPLFRRFPGLVRQTAAGLGKAAELVISGEDVELDKSVADGLFEPLLHLIRNAVDHGVEAPEVRRAAGKPVPAPLRLSAEAVGEEVVIEVADDGAGLDLDRIRRTAGRRGVLSAEAATALSDDEAAALIFAPGFSTAAAVTDLSGRGVGLDAVRAGVAALGGQVQVRSRAGQGTRFILNLPLRVRLARLMVVEAAGEPFGVPLESVIETVRADPGRLTPVRAGKALVWRDRPAPVLRLSDLLGLPPRAAPDEELKLMIVQAGAEVAAVAVDAFGERLEAPLRPMSGLLSRLPGLAGATLMGDGRVLMVLDVPELIG